MISKSSSENKWELAHSFGTIYGMEEASVILEVLNEGAPTTSHKVRDFEKGFAELVGAKHGVAANSWVGAAHLLAILLDFKDGDEIIVPAMTFQSSANIFSREGAKIVFADSDPRTFNIDPQKIEEKITPKTRAIVVVHMCGQPCDMDAIIEIALRHNIIVIQDAAHAPGAKYKGKGLGELGDFTIYSFQQTKNISTLGEGGMIVTDNKEWADNMRKLRGHGRGLFIGISTRMTEIQAAVGIVQLSRLDLHNQTRRKLAHYLNMKLSDIGGITTPFEIEDVKHVYHLYNILIDKDKLGISRDELLKQLWIRKSIMVAAQYSPTVNCLEAYKKLGYCEGQCPVAEDLASRLLSLPISPRFTEKDMDELVDEIKLIIESKLIRLPN